MGDRSRSRAQLKLPTRCLRLGFRAKEGAGAIVSALLGEINPGGKLPVSIARSVGQVPVFYNHKPSGMRSNIYGDYVNESVKPLFPFGHGLSYTQFEYSNLSLDKQHAGLDESLQISFDVKTLGASLATRWRSSTPVMSTRSSHDQ